MHQNPVKNILCLNCGSELNGKYCSNCGQLSRTKRINIKEIISNFFSTNLSLNSPLLLTIRLLINNPGKIYREYISGKRKTYYRPIAFFLLFTGIFLILRSVIDFDPLEDVFLNNGKENLSGLENEIETTARLMEKNINNILFLLVFSIAFNLKLFFSKKYNLAEYISIGFYIVGLYTVSKILTMFIGKYTWFPVDNLELVIVFILIFYSTFSLFQKRDLIHIIKYLFVSLLSLLLYFILSTGFFLTLVLLR